jgi:hypothetical protein
MIKKTYKKLENVRLESRARAFDRCTLDHRRTSFDKMVGDTKRLLNPWSFIAHLAAMSRVNVLESRRNMTRSCSAGFCPRVKKNYQAKKLFLCIMFLWPREYRENDFVL